MTEVETREIGLVLAAAGRGSRFGGSTPKQFRLLQNGLPVYLTALEKFIPRVRKLVVVVSGDLLKQAESEVSAFLGNRSFAGDWLIVEGGDSRQESVVRGLRSLSALGCSHVLVHDAARPFLGGALIDRVIEATYSFGAAIPLEPLPDTIKVTRDGFVEKTLNRDLLGRAQTPQGSELIQLLEAAERALSERFPATDESILLEREGFKVKAVAGEKANIKITWQDDLEGA